MPDLSAAFLLAQLENLHPIHETRRRIWNRYEAGLSSWAEDHGVRLPHVPAECGSAYHMFHLLLPSLAARTAFIEHLAASGIKSSFHYVPLHKSEFAATLGAAAARCPFTEDLSDRLVRLPFYNDLTTADQARVIRAVCAFRPKEFAPSPRRSPAGPVRLA
jgi:dTDP-4-amino-4,6-dideoxygalactose transaminase